MGATEAVTILLGLWLAYRVPLAVTRDLLARRWPVCQTTHPERLPRAHRAR